MRTETVTTFYCEKCGTGYRSERLARHCENGALPAPPVELSAGQKIWIAVDHQMDAVKFGAWDYGARIGLDQSANRELPDGDKHIDYLLTVEPTHELLIRLAEVNHYEGYEQTHASPRSTAIGKRDKKSITGDELYVPDSEWYE